MSAHTTVHLTNGIALHTNETRTAVYEKYRQCVDMPTFSLEITGMTTPDGRMVKSTGPIADVVAAHVVFINGTDAEEDLAAEAAATALENPVGSGWVGQL